LAADLAAVVVHYGDPAPTARCLDSLAGIEEVVLVDQPPFRFGSHPAVTARIETPRNVGFAAACNLGVARTSAPFVLLLNNDAVLAPDAAALLRAAIGTFEPDIAGACLKLLCMDGVTLQSAGGLWFTRDGIGFPHGFGEIDRGQYDSLAEAEIGVPSGAAALYRTSAWREAGGMPEEFFCYCEDGDVGLAMIAAGHRFAWLPDVRVLHELSSSSAAHSMFKAYHVERNHFATAVHAAPLPMIATLPLYTAGRVLALALDAMRSRGAGAGLAGEASAATLAATLLRAWAGALAMTPAALVRRRALHSHHRDASARIARFLKTRRTPLPTFIRSRNV
jgi:GT2 family glycosyltransferase